MLEPIVSFFDKLIENFSWRRLFFLFVALALSGAAALVYETYTQSFKLSRIERQVGLLERLGSLSANAGVATEQTLQQSYKELQRQLQLTTQELDGQYELQPWGKKMLATAVAWAVFACFMLLIPESYSTAKNAPGAVFFGVLVVAAPFVVLAAAVPTISPMWLNYTLYPIGHLVLIVIAIKLWQGKRSIDRVVAASACW